MFTRALSYRGKRIKEMVLLQHPPFQMSGGENTTSFSLLMSFVGTCFDLLLFHIHYLAHNLKTSLFLEPTTHTDTSTINTNISCRAASLVLCSLRTRMNTRLNNKEFLLIDKSVRTPMRHSIHISVIFSQETATIFSENSLISSTSTSSRT